MAMHTLAFSSPAFRQHGSARQRELPAVVWSHPLAFGLKPRLDPGHYDFFGNSGTWPLFRDPVWQPSGLTQAPLAKPPKCNNK